MRRPWKVAGIAALALLLAVAATTGILLGSQAGSRWLLARLPGLTVDGFSGRLGGDWQAERLAWRGDGLSVVVDTPRLAWSPGCLLRLRLCIGRLVADTLEVTTAPTVPAEQENEPFSLPSLKLPLSMRIEELQLGHLKVNGSEQLADLRLVAQWTASGLQLDELRVRRDDLRLQLNGRVEPSGDWPLDATATVQLPAPEARPWSLRLRAQGPLQGQLALTGDSSGYLAGRLEGQVRPLAEQLPARLTIHASGFKAVSSLPDTLTLNDLVLSAEGDLGKGYAVQGEALLPAEQTPMTLALRGSVDAAGARIATLELADGERKASLDGTLDWHDGLVAEAKLDWRDFPWQRLYALAESPPVELKTLRAELSYRDAHYLGHFEAALRGPAGPFSLASPVSGDLQAVHLPALRLEAGQGTLEGQLGLDFTDGLRWDAALDLAGFDPSYWVEQLPGTLAGPLRSQGQLLDGRLQLQAALQLTGRLRGQPTQLRLDALGGGERWRLQALDLRLGDNRIQGEGQAADDLAGHLDVTLMQLGQLWPGLQGQLTGALRVAGSPAAPQGSLDLSGRRIALDEKQIASLQLAATLDARQRGRLSLNGKGIRVGDTDLGALDLSARGDRQRQQLHARLDGPKLAADLALDGELQTSAKGWSWRGRLAEGQLDSGGQRWRLQQPARLQRLASGEIDLGAHCWKSGEASLCGGDQRLQPEPRLRYRLSHFPLDSLAQWMPDDFVWHGQLEGELSLDLPASGPNGHLRLDAGNGALRLRDSASQAWIDLPYRTLTLDTQLRPQRVDSTLAFVSDKLGQLDLQASIDPRPANKPLEGRFRLGALDLSVLRPFVPEVEDLQGRLDGEGRLGGSLQAPSVDGQLRLSQGRVGGGNLPTRLDDLQLTADIAGERLRLHGGWRSGEQGQGNLDGEVAWNEGLDADLHLTGSRLATTLEPYAQLEVTPDLHLKLAEDRLALSGRVEIPRGDIHIRQLPPSTVKVSADTVIVGRQPAQKTPLQIAMDIDVLVGRDKLAFSGFGLEATVAGRVHIGDNLDTRGELRLNDGRYRAYGQRLTIRRARLLFAGPIEQPYLDVEAVRQVDDVTAGLRLKGNVTAPTSEVFSEPSMGQEQALAYLVLGRPLSSDSEDNNMLAQAALGLGLAGSASTAGRLAGNLGIKDFQLDTEGSGKTTSVMASGRLTDKLTLRYGVGVFEPANTVGLRYQLTRRLFLEAASGLASSLDLFYKRDF